MPLSTNDRIAVNFDFQRERSQVNDPLPGMVKADLQAAVNAIDDWIDTNAASLNSAIPQPARGALTLTQKNLLFQRVLQRRVKGT